MNNKNRKIRLSTRANEALTKLFQRASFQKEVLNIRQEMGMPSKGFHTFKEWKRWIYNRQKERDKVERGLTYKELKSGVNKDWPNAYEYITYAISDMLDTLKLPLTYCYWLEAYIVLGEKYLSYSPKLFINMDYGFDELDFSNAIEFDKQWQAINIRILPGGSVKETKRFLDKNRLRINSFLNKYRNERILPTRKNRVKERNNLIYKYFSQGILKKSGIWTYGRPDNVSAEIKKVNTDYLKKIIREQINLRK